MCIFCAICCIRENKYQRTILIKSAKIFLSSQKHINKSLLQAKEWKDLKICILMNKVSLNPFLLRELQEAYNDLYLLESILYDRISYKRSISEGLGINEQTIPKHT